MFTITKTFEFSAAHILTNVPTGHPCGNLHGHNYTIEIAFSSENTKNNWVLDFRELEPIKKMIDQDLDHKMLTTETLKKLCCNKVEFLQFCEETTSENLSRCLFEWCENTFKSTNDDIKVAYVKVSETPKTSAKYST